MEHSSETTGPRLFSEVFPREILEYAAKYYQRMKDEKPGNVMETHYQGCLDELKSDVMIKLSQNDINFAYTAEKMRELSQKSRKERGILDE